MAKSDDLSSIIAVVMQLSHCRSQDRLKSPSLLGLPLAEAFASYCAYIYRRDPAEG
jgi:hypothetical protein